MVAAPHPMALGEVSTDGSADNHRMYLWELRILIRSPTTGAPSTMPPKHPECRFPNGHDEPLICKSLADVIFPVGRSERLRYITDPLIIIIMDRTHFYRNHPIAPLTHVFIQTVDQSAVIPGNPVTDVHVKASDQFQLEDYLTISSNIARSTIPISFLSFDLEDKELTIYAYTTIVANLPHLRVLRMSHNTEFMLDRTTRETAINIVGSLQHLEELTWDGEVMPVVEEALFNLFIMGSRCCPALRKITFGQGLLVGQGNVIGLRTFERVSSDTPWEISKTG